MNKPDLSLVSRDSASIAGEPVAYPSTPSPEEARIAPESYTLDSALLARPGNDEIQLDLFLDYASNVALYPKFRNISD